MNDARMNPTTVAGILNELLESHADKVTAETAHAITGSEVDWMAVRMTNGKFADSYAKTLGQLSKLGIAKRN